MVSEILPAIVKLLPCHVLFSAIIIYYVQIYAIHIMLGQKHSDIINNYAINPNYFHIEQ
jgi:hypothetical protein